MIYEKPNCASCAHFSKECDEEPCSICSQLPDGGNVDHWEPDISNDSVFIAVSTMQAKCHTAAQNWWKDNQGHDIRENPLTFSNKLMLIVSEVSEAMEGDRKGLKDDKLPHRDMREVELADALIRICDLAGGYGLDLAGAVVEKLAYNAKRIDHTPEHRKGDGGKAY